MTRIDFHILQSSDRSSQMQYGCLLTEKATRQGHKVMIFTDGPDTTSSLDKLLWTHRPESFVPHTTSVDESRNTPVYITHEQETASFHDVLVTLHGGDPPSFFSQFERVIEIVSQEPQQLNQSRINYKFYKSRGYQMNIHQVNR